MDASNSAPRVPLRPLGGPRPSVPTIGLDLSYAAGISGPSAPSPARSWARAVARGAALVHLATPGAASAESRLGAARGDDPPSLSALIALADGRPSPPALGADLTERLAGAARESVLRLGKATTVFPCVLPNQAAWLDRPETIVMLDRLRTEGAIGGWGAAIGPRTRVDRLSPVADAGASFFLLEANLIDYGKAYEAVDALAGTSAALVVRDPHAGGLLDGSFVRGTSVAEGPGPRFERWEELESRMRAVTRLGFLTADRRRTLAEVAVQFALSLPRVASVLVRPDDPPTLDAALRGAALPALDPAELERIGRAVTGDSPAAKPPG